MRIAVTIFLVLVQHIVCRAQSLSASFSFPTDPYTICRNEPLNLTNSSIGASEYLWDFCTENFRETPTVATIANLASLSDARYKLVKGDGVWFGFITNRGTNTIYRLDFGTNPLEPPTLVTEIQLPNGLLNAPENMEVYKHNGLWHGFIGGSGDIVHVEFGASLTNVTPNAQKLNLTNKRYPDLQIVEQGGNLILLAVVLQDNALLRLNFSGSLNNVPTQSTVSISTVEFPLSVSVVKRGTDWVAHVSSLIQNGSTKFSVTQLNFGNDILGIPTNEKAFNLAGVAVPFKIRVIPEAGKYYAIIGNESLTLSLIDLKGMMVTEVPEVLPNTGLSVSIGMEPFKYESKNVIHTISGTNLRMNIFERTCQASASWSNQALPLDVTFDQATDYTIDLSANNETGTNSYAYNTLTVRSDISPSLSINFSSLCSTAANELSATSTASLISWNWELGNTMTSTDESPVIMYNAGSYQVKLIAEATNSCRSLAFADLTVYNPPSATFSLPTGLICTNNEFTFVNSTVDNFDGNLSFQWLLDDVPVSTVEDLLLTFNSGGDKEITLQASIPGCSSESVQIVTGVGEGPTVDFTLTGNCLNESTLLTNNSQGAIAGYSWDFGDGQTSTDLNPTVNYTAAGNYTVELETLGSNGCISKRSLPHQIFSVPQPNFNIDLPPFSCNGTPTQFNDLTPTLIDSNLDTWQWNFADQNASASIQHPQYTYALSGDYNVSLTVTSDQGCVATTNKTITIAQSPLPVIVNTPACVETAVVLQDGAATSASAWQWQVGNNFYFTESPSHVFTTAGDYEISLTLTASNGCVGTTTKQVAVPLPLTVNFESAFNCANTASQFTAVVNDIADPVANHTWLFGDDMRSGATVNYLYSAPGTEEVQLIASTQNGCAYTITKAITILPAPVADFSFTPGSGAPPLAVTFTNQSVNANSFLWKFNDAANTTSSLQSPAFTFTDFGEYAVDLTAKNSAGCESTVSKLITVALPRINVTLDNFRIIPNTDGSFLLLTNILNNGNVLVQNPKIEIRLDNAATIQEVLNTNIVAGASIDYTLSTLVGANNNLNYACIRLVLPNNEAKENTEACITFEANTAITSPYPNPANELVTVEWISPTEESVSVMVNDYLGNVMATETISSQQGLNTLKLQTLDWQAGIYFIRIRSNSREHFFRTIIAR